MSDSPYISCIQGLFTTLLDSTKEDFVQSLSGGNVKYLLPDAAALSITLQDIMGNVVVIHTSLRCQRTLPVFSASTVI